MWLVALKVAGVGAVLFLAIVVMLVISAYLEARIDVANRPRVPMSWCPRHGFFKKEHTLKLEGTPIDMCPGCYWDAIKKAKA